MLLVDLSPFILILYYFSYSPGTSKVLAPLINILGSSTSNFQKTENLYNDLSQFLIGKIVWLTYLAVIEIGMIYAG